MLQLPENIAKILISVNYFINKPTSLFIQIHKGDMLTDNNQMNTI